MSVGVMTVGFTSVGEITVRVMTVGVMTVGVMRRPRLLFLTVTPINSANDDLIMLSLVLMRFLCKTSHKDSCA
jgi:hypothetical protein